jgi:hypothetical protein
MDKPLADELGRAQRSPMSFFSSSATPPPPPRLRQFERAGCHGLQSVLGGDHHEDVQLHRALLQEG